MFNILIVLAILASILLILIVAIQNPKGGGLASNFSGANQMLGARRTNEEVERFTWILSVALLVISLGTMFFINSGNLEEKQSKFQENIDNAEFVPNAAEGASIPPMEEENNAQ
ncbi:MAG: preprotein translocase subunit SecG [Bacteroidota bacterium]|nr:preprotein translocase subunit SecG [Bacteroidota bacterium]